MQQAAAPPAAAAAAMRARVARAFAMTAGADDPGRAWAREYLYDTSPETTLRVLTNREALRYAVTSCNSWASFEPRGRGAVAAGWLGAAAAEAAGGGGGGGGGGGVYDFNEKAEYMLVPHMAFAGLSAGAIVSRHANLGPAAGGEEESRADGDDLPGAEYRVGRYVRDEHTGDMLAMEHHRGLGGGMYPCGRSVGFFLGCGGSTTRRERLYFWCDTQRFRDGDIPACVEWCAASDETRGCVVCGVAPGAAGDPVCGCLFPAAVPRHPTDWEVAPAAMKVHTGDFVGTTRVLDKFVLPVGGVGGGGCGVGGCAEIVTPELLSRITIRGFAVQPHVVETHRKLAKVLQSFAVQVSLEAGNPARGVMPGLRGPGFVMESGAPERPRVGKRMRAVGGRIGVGVGLGLGGGGAGGGGGMGGGEVVVRGRGVAGGVGYGGGGRDAWGNADGMLCGGGAGYGVGGRLAPPPLCVDDEEEDEGYGGAYGARMPAAASHHELFMAQCAPRIDYSHDLDAQRRTAVLAQHAGAERRRQQALLDVQRRRQLAMFDEQHAQQVRGGGGGGGGGGGARRVGVGGGFGGGAGHYPMYSTTHQVSEQAVRASMRTPSPSHSAPSVPTATSTPSPLLGAVNGVGGVDGSVYYTPQDFAPPPGRYAAPDAAVGVGVPLRGGGMGNVVGGVGGYMPRHGDRGARGQAVVIPEALAAAEAALNAASVAAAAAAGSATLSGSGGSFGSWLGTGDEFDDADLDESSAYDGYVNDVDAPVAAEIGIGGVGIGGVGPGSAVSGDGGTGSRPARNGGIGGAAAAGGTAAVQVGAAPRAPPQRRAGKVRTAEEEAAREERRKNKNRASATRANARRKERNDKLKNELREAKARHDSLQRRQLDLLMERKELKNRIAQQAAGSGGTV